MLRKVPFAQRLAVIAGAIAVLVSAMSPAVAAPAERHTGQVAKEPRRVPLAKRLANTPGGGSGYLLLEWKIIAMLRP